MAAALCAAVLGTSKDGLPIGVQLVGPYWSEPELLHIARQLAPLTNGFVAPAGLLTLIEQTKRPRIGCLVSECTHA